MTFTKIIIITILSLFISLNCCCFSSKLFGNENSGGTPTETPQATTAEDWYIKGNHLCFDKGNYEEGIKCYDKAIELKPDYTDAWYNRSMALYNCKKYEEAIESFDKTLALEERYGTWYYKGIALYSLEKYEEAVECFNKALEIEPDDKEALKMKEEALKKGGEGSLSLNVLENATYKNYNSLPGFPEEFKLVDGEFSEIKDNAAIWAKFYSPPKIAAGDLDNDEKDDAAFILLFNDMKNTGYSSLTAVLNQNGKPFHVASAVVENAAKIEDIEISRGNIFIDIYTAMPGESAVNSSIRAIIKYHLEGNQLKSELMDCGEFFRKLKKGDLAEIKESLEENPLLINFPDEYGSVPIVKAVISNRADIIELLVLYGADVNVLSESGEMPLHLAVKAGNKELVQILLNNGAHTEVKDINGKTPLKIAEEEGQEEIIELLRK